MRFIRVVCATTLALAASFGSTAASAEVPDLLKAQTGRVTYVDFWASWCAPCAQSFPWLNEMQAKYGARGLRIVGVGVDTQTAKGDRFLQQHPAQIAIVRDPQGALAQHYAVEGMPYAVLLDAQGHVLHRHTGFRVTEVAQYERAIEDALSTQGSHP